MQATDSLVTQNPKGPHPAVTAAWPRSASVCVWPAKILKNKIKLNKSNERWASQKGRAHDGMKNKNRQFLFLTKLSSSYHSTSLKTMHCLVYDTSPSSVPGGLTQHLPCLGQACHLVTVTDNWEYAADFSAHTGMRCYLDLNHSVLKMYFQQQFIECLLCAGVWSYIGGRK